jgi:hypothetical protein
VAIYKKNWDLLRSAGLGITQKVRAKARRLSWGRQVILWACCALTIYAALAFGATQAWSFYPLGLCLAVLSLFLLASGLQVLRTSAKSQTFLPQPPLWPGLLAAVVLMLVQVAPLPAWLVGFVSPAALEIRALGNGYGLGAYLPLSLNPYSAWVEFLKLWPAMMLFFILLYTVQSRRQIQMLAEVILAVGFFEAFYGLWHFHSHLIWGWKNHYTGMRLCGTFINSDHLAGYLTMAILLGFGLFLAFKETVPALPRNLSGRKWLAHLSRAEHLEPQFRRYLLLFILLLLTVALIFTGSRGGMISLVVGFALIGFLLVGQRWKWGHLYLMAGFLAVAVLYSLWLGSAPYLGRFWSLDDKSRYLAFKGALAVFREFPWTGSGIGTFGDLFYRYEPAELGARWFKYTHSEWLQVLAETGIFGFALVTGLWLTFFHRLVREWQRRQDVFSRGLGLGALAALAAGAFHAVGEFPFRIPAFTLAYATVAAIGYLAIFHYGKEREFFSYPMIKFPARPVMAAAVVLGLLAGQMILMMRAWHFWQAERAAPTEIDSTRANPPLIGREDWQWAITRNPANSKYYVGLAQAREKNWVLDPDALGEAEMMYQQAIHHSPANWVYHVKLAEYYLRYYRVNLAQNLPRALKESAAAVNLFPESGMLHLQLGTLLAWMERHHAQLVPPEFRNRWVLHLQKALQLDPSLKKYLHPKKG